MDDARGEINVIRLSQPYVDPIAVLDGNYSTKLASSSNHNQTQLNHFDNYYLKLIRILITLILILIFLPYSIYEIVLGCYNCPIETSNLPWIRASFLLNIPLVLTLFIYIFLKLTRKSMINFNDFLLIIIIYISITFSFSIFFAIPFQVDELIQLNDLLYHTVDRHFLICSINHYRQVFGMMIMNLCSPVLLIIAIYIYLYTNQKKYKKTNEQKRLDNFFFDIYSSLC